jgi:hypothetical protein
MSRRHTIALEIRLDGEPVESETTCIWATPYVFVVASTLPSAGLAITVHSTFVGHEDVPTSAVHLTVGPAGVPAALRVAHHDNTNLDPKINSRACVYEHCVVVLDYLQSLGRAATQHIPQHAFAALERIEGMT